MTGIGRASEGDLIYSKFMMYVASKNPRRPVVSCKQKPKSEEPLYFSIGALAKRWDCSRGSVYNRIRGYVVLDFARPGHKGKKSVSLAVVRQIEEKHTKLFR